MTAPLPLKTLTCPAVSRDKLLAAGLTGAEADAKADYFARGAARLLAGGADADTPTVAVYVPGRLEILGKHTDYGGGRSLVAAAGRGVCMVATGRTDAAVRAAAMNLDEDHAFTISPELHTQAGHWANYLKTVARRVARNFPGELRGVDLAFGGDVPSAAGMSSSSTLVTGFFLVLDAVNGLAGRPEYTREIDETTSLAEYLGTVENGQSYGSLVGDRGVGTFGGSEDHVAMLCSQSGQLSQYSYCPVRLEQAVALPAGYTFAVAACGVTAEKTGQAMADYNRASQMASAVTAAWNAATDTASPNLATILRDPDLPNAADRLRRVVAGVADGPWTSEQLGARLEHFIAESEEILPAAADGLLADDLDAFGKQVDRSQQLAGSLLGNQIPETIYLAAAARQCGAAAASAFGAGFGGSVWALVSADAVDAFLDKWHGRYADRYPGPAAHASFFATQAGPAAFRL